MKDYLLRIMKKNKNGLYLCELPTGYGKTRNCVHAMKEYIDIMYSVKKYADTINDNQKIIYLTTQNKNLPEKALQIVYGNKNLYKKNVLRIRSNFDEVVEKIDKIEVHKDLRSKVYDKLYTDIKLYRDIKDKDYVGKNYISELSERIEDDEKKFRCEIRNYMRNNFSNKDERKNAIAKNPKYKWIGKLYPAVFTDEHKILLMSVSKFMKKNSIIIDESYGFLNSDIINNAIIIIDEFDATKATIQEELIRNSLLMKEYYIQLFRQIYRMLKPDDFSVDMTQALKNIENNKKNTFKILMDKAEDIAQNYHTNLSIKTKENMIDHKRAFLFSDGSFHNIFSKKTQYIRAALNTEDNRIDVFFESKEDFFKNLNKDKDIVLYGMLREINNFLSYFRIFVIKWAQNYMKIVNNKRDFNADKMSLDNAINSILDRLGLNANQRKFIMDENYKIIRKTKEPILEDMSFYQVGMEYYEFEDNDSHYDSTNLKFVKVHNTPEKILLFLVKKATVIGISASAEFDTVIGNYNLHYLKEQLKEDYHSTPEDLKKRIKEELESRWLAYNNGKIKIHGEVIPSGNQNFDAEEYCSSFLNKEFASCANNLISQIISKKYVIRRYCNILRAMHIFCKTQDIQSMLYLDSAFPKKNNPEMDEDKLKELFDLVIEESEVDKDKAFFVLCGDNFDKNKEKLLERLENGEKIFVMSSYQTIGAGQNLQYKIPEAKKEKMVYLGERVANDERFLNKDFDALYLGNITNIIVNTYSDNGINESELLEMLFQIDELYENGEISYLKKDEMLKLAFYSYSGSKQFNKLYNSKSVIVQANKIVLQAVGRICRTFAKNPNIYLFVESELLNKVYIGELKKHILSPEMDKIVAMREELGKDYSPTENKILNEAEKISTSNWKQIQIIISRDWTKETMESWKNLRELVLKYPTASKSEWETNEYLKKYYITSGEKQNCYLYSQYSDFKDVIIDFGNDKIAFRNSKRAKYKGNSEEVAIYEMSEKESSLPIILKYPKIREHFEKNGYAINFNKNDYLMSPIIFHNIYKGALGEVAGKFILQRELDIKLKPITNPEYYEFFDYILSDNVYVDFKNWKYSYIQDKDETHAKILRKADAIGAKRVYIINILSNKDYKPTTRVDDRLVEIPMLIDEEGKVNKESLNMIHREDFESC